MWPNLIPVEHAAPARGGNIETVEITHEDKLELEDQIRVQVARGWTVKSRSHTADGSHAAQLFRRKG